MLQVFPVNVGSGAGVRASRAPATLRPGIPAPLHWREEIAGLQEVGATVAMELWRALRAVRLWADTPPGRRSKLLAPLPEEVRDRIGRVCAEAPGLIEALGTFTALLREPQSMDGRQLAQACHHVHEWADTRGMLGTAMYFAEAAAVCDPGDAARANVAARMCRRMVLDERAAAWYLRGFGLAARTGNHREAVWALLGYGTLLKDQGRHEEARRFIDRAARRAENTGRRREAAECQHDLLCLAAEMGEYREAERRTRLATSLYPSLHPRIPHVVHDFAFILVRQHHYSHALALLDSLVRVLPRPGEQALVYGTISRAAGGARRRDRFEEARAEAVRLAEAHEEFASAVLVNVAEGARAFGEWERAERLAERAVEIARSRKDGLVEQVALELLDRISRREPAPDEATPRDQERIQALTLRLTAKLQKWKAPAGARTGAGSTPREKSPPG